MNDIAARQRAQLFADVDNLKLFKREMQARNMELVQFEIETTQRFINNAEEAKKTLQGCLTLIECDEELGKRMDVISDRIDIVNKRLRKLEQAVKP